MIALLGIALLHVIGAALTRAAGRATFVAALRSPSSIWVAIAVLYAASLGWAGAVLIVALLGTVFVTRGRAPEGPPFRWLPFGGLAFVALARPWVPTLWDEWVWLGKARLEAFSFGGVARATLQTDQHLIPAGYPTLWPSSVAWASLGVDSIDAQVVAAALLVVLAAATAAEAWLPLLERTPRWAALAIAVSAPLVWVHVRSAYVDLPVGLLSAALLGHLIAARDRQALSLTALALGVVLAGMKDEGAPAALAACTAALVTAKAGQRSYRLVLPAVLALVTVAVWRALQSAHGVENSDHGLNAPYWPWVPALARLVTLHATDFFSWGIFWPVVAAGAIWARRDERSRTLIALLVINALLLSAALVFGPERVRVFAENGTLVNRLLMQLWPAAALLLLRSQAIHPLTER